MNYDLRINSLLHGLLFMKAQRINLINKEGSLNVMINGCYLRHGHVSRKNYEKNGFHSIASRSYWKNFIYHYPEIILRYSITFIYL